MADGAESAAARAPVARKIWPTDDDVIAGVGERDLAAGIHTHTHAHTHARTYTPMYSHTHCGRDTRPGPGSR